MLLNRSAPTRDGRRRNDLNGGISGQNEELRRLQSTVQDLVGRGEVSLPVVRRRRTYQLEEERLTKMFRPSHHTEYVYVRQGAFHDLVFW